MKARVDERLAGMRLDRALMLLLPGLSRAKVQRLIKDGLCLVDGQAARADAKTRTGQEIALALETLPSALRPEEGKTAVLWESPDLIVCDKPPGLTVHPCPSCAGNTLIQRLLAAYPELARMEGERPGIVHRLDKDTSGVIAVALNERARLRLSSDFAERKVAKEYLALVAGSPPAAGECLEPIGRSPANKTKMAVVPVERGGREARTEWRRIWRSPDKSVSLLLCRIHTGRTHQIRVHLANRGFPILGDQLYAPAAVKSMAPRQMLHAFRLKFANPADGREVFVEAPPPQDFIDAANARSRARARLVVTGVPGSGKSTLREIIEKKGVPCASADAIVARLYSRPGAVSDWLLQNGAQACLKPDKSVDKAALYQFLKESPASRRAFETYVHNLVADEILAFWGEHDGADISGAEIPLYFESPARGRYAPPPFAVGVRCPAGARRERLKESRGWDPAKIDGLDAWQLPEPEKMARCDFVIDNDGDLAALERKAEALLRGLRDGLRRESELRRAEFLTLVGAGKPSAAP